MIIILSYLAIVLSSFSHLIKNFPRKNIFIFLSFTIIFIVSTRYASTDYFSYLSIYQSIDSIELSKLKLFIYELKPSTPIENGFFISIILEKLIFGNYFIFIIFFSTISLLIKFTAFKKISPYYILSLLIYMSNEYFWKDLGQMRNGFASGIILWALYHAYFKRLFIFLILVLTAALFHSSAIIALPFYFVRHIKSKLLMLISLTISFIIVIIFGGIGSILVDMSSALGIDNSSRLIKYATTKYSAGMNLYGGTILLQTFICLTFIYTYKKYSNAFPIASYFIPIFVYTTCLLILFNDYSIIGSRINDLIVLPIGCILIPSILLLLKENSRLIVLLLIITYSLLWFYMMLNNNPEYQSMLPIIFNY